MENNYFILESQNDLLKFEKNNFTFDIITFQSGNGAGIY